MLLFTIYFNRLVASSGNTNDGLNNLASSMSIKPYVININTSPGETSLAAAPFNVISLLFLGPGMA